MSIRPLGWISLALLLGAAPAIAQQAPATAAKSAAPAAAAAGPIIDPGPDDLPRGAPRDDYQFVGWCEGALATHMQLYVSVKPELDAISARWNTAAEDAKDYSDQQVAGREDLALFESAMHAAEAASTRNLAPTGQAAVQSGVAMWKELDTVDARNQAYSWMNWELPERCIKIANDLQSRSLLMAPLLRDTSKVAVAPAEPKAIVPPANPIPTPAAQAPTQPGTAPKPDTPSVSSLLR